MIVDPNGPPWAWIRIALMTGTHLVEHIETG